MAVDRDFDEFVRKKVANIIIFFADGQTTSLKRIIKLMFIADESSVKRYGVPISWLKYFAWVQGPVPSQMYLELEKQAGIEKNEALRIKNKFQLDGFIKASAAARLNANQRSVDITPRVPFDDAEFTEYELEILREVKEKFGSWSITKLIEYTHGKNTLWGKVVRSNRLNRVFQYQSKTDFQVAFFPILRGDKFKTFVQAQKSLEYQNALI